MSFLPTARPVGSLVFEQFALHNTKSTTNFHPPSPGTLGISTYAAKTLGDVVYVELPEVSTAVAAGDAIGSVESVKSASDILTPVAGTVQEVNETLGQKPGDINRDPEGEAWIARIALEGEVDTKDLMTAEQYNEFAGEA